MKRLFALLLGGLGLRALLRRHSEPALESSPAADLRAKLAETRAAPEPEPERAPETDPDARRADVHARARQAIDDLRDESQ